MKYNNNEYFGLWNDINSENGIDYIPNYQNYLEEFYEGTTHSALDFLHGYCFVYAYFLAKKTGWNITVVKDYTGKIIHVYCAKNLGGIIYYCDIRGATTDSKKFFEEFGVDVNDKNLNQWFSFKTYHNDIRGQIDIFFDKFVKDCGIDEFDYKTILADGQTFVDLFI